MLPTLVALSLAAAMLPTFAEGSSANDPGETCRAMAEPLPPVVDRPTPTQAGSLRGCDPQDLYYGVRVAQDYTRARKCAMLQLKTTNGNAATANRILAQLYANGFGVKTNRRLALSYACRSDPTEQSFLDDVAGKGTQAGNSLKTVDFCNDIAGTPAITFCASLHKDAAESFRERRLEQMIGELSIRAQKAYSKMLMLRNAFEDVRSREESGNTGTSASAEDLEGEERALQFDDKDIRAFLSGNWSVGVDSRVADHRLNVNYHAALTYAASHPDDGVTSDGVREAQRAWLKFRDAFVLFAAAARPNFPQSAVLGHLTEARASELKRLTETS